MNGSTKIHDIAKALGVSIGTVDRALHDRPGVNPLTKSRVLQMAKTLGYQPNQAARFLSSKRRLRISVNLPAHIESFWDTVREGIEEEAKNFAAFGLDIEFRTFPRMGYGEQAAFDEALDAEVNGIIIATGRPQDLRLSILKASRARIPVVSVVTDAPGTARLAVVSIDSPASGALAGELLSRLLQGKGKLAVITGDLAITDHAEKYNSFRSSVSEIFPAVRVIEPVQNHEDETEAYETCRALLREHPDLNGLYISTANSSPVLQALQDVGRLDDRMTIITTDLFPALIPHIESGRVVATLYQRPRSQGQLALRMLHEFLAGGRCPSHQLRLAPHIIMKSNLNFFLDRVSMESDEVEDSNTFRPAATARKLRRLST
ncbi:MAG: LacI family DNA-binding transcriptional regulator [Candidatus Acidiferrales bacterium]